MNDFTVIARLLAAIRAYDGKPFNAAAVSPAALKTDEATRDLLALKLQNAGYIEGLITTEDIDNAPQCVLWRSSSPSITLAGLEYAQECKPLHKAIQTLAQDAVTAAVSATASGITNLL
ncbi:YjcQ family protein [Olsenella massiliensis]|uniref:YjcQ family protein n=1 Tax=Olsenella massiliensis TaxID=1622075 RepID=UPI00071D7617|nr:YjcQ family protein [Olsenella massiliensis]